MLEDEDDDPSFFQRFRAPIIIGAVLLLGGIGFLLSKNLSSHGGSSHSENMAMVSLPPPPPPPPPKIQPTPPPQQQPTPEQQQEQKMEEQQPVQQEKKEEAPKDKPPDPAPLGTGITGPGGGPDLGLGSGLGGGGGYGSGGGGGTKYGWYASEVQSHIADAVRANARTRTASMNFIVRIWPDSTGRITKVRVSGAGDPALQSVLENEVLNNLSIGDAPPSDMPLPIVMRLTAQRPQ